MDTKRQQQKDDLLGEMIQDRLDRAEKLLDEVGLLSQARGHGPPIYFRGLKCDPSAGYEWVVEESASGLWMSSSSEC